MDWNLPLLANPGSFWVPTLVLGGLYGVRYVVFAGTAYALGYRHGVVSRWHKPDSAPRFDTVSRVCAALGVRLVAKPVRG